LFSPGHKNLIEEEGRLSAQNDKDDLMTDYHNYLERHHSAKSHISIQVIENPIEEETKRRPVDTYCRRSFELEPTYSEIIRRGENIYMGFKCF